MNPSSWAGVIGAIGSCITALALLVTARATSRNSRRVESKVDEVQKTGHEVHVIVNSQRTEMQTIIVNQQQQLLRLEAAMAKAGLVMPVAAETTGEPIVATALIVHKTDDGDVS